MATDFIINTNSRSLLREKEKAKALRRTAWWQRRLARGVCHYCGRPTPSEDLTMDHIVPLIRGGRTTRGNVVPACKECNNSKKYLLPWEWEKYLAELPRASTVSDEET